MPRKSMDSSASVIKKPRKTKNVLSHNYNLVRSELSLFDEPPVDVSIINSYYSEYFPLNAVSDKSSPIQFFVPGSDQHYVDLRETRLFVRGKIVRVNGSALAVDEVVAPINNLLHSLFSQCTISLNETQITSPNMYYAFRAYLETLLGYGKEFKKSQAQCAMYFRDKDVENTDATVEDGYKKRYDLCKESKTFELYGRPHADLFMQNRYLIPGVDMRISFERSTDDFCIFAPNAAANKYKIELEEVLLHIKRHIILPSLVVNNFRLWEQGNKVCMPMRKVEVKAFSIPTGSMQIINENLLSGQLPDRIILCLVNSQWWHGTQVSNPFVFKGYNLSYINVSLDTDQITSRPFELDFSDTQPRYMRAYYNIFDTLGYSDCDVGLDMTLDEFKNGKQFYTFQLRHLTDNFLTPKYGSVKIELKFKPGTTVPLTVLCYAEYQSVLYVDSSKNIYFKDYSVP
jgi:hypothetical protein